MLGQPLRESHMYDITKTGINIQFNFGKNYLLFQKKWGGGI